MNPENVTLVLEEASRRLGDETEDKDLKRAAEKKSFKKTVKVKIISVFLLQAHLVKNSIRVATRSSKVTTTETCGDPAKYETNNSNDIKSKKFLSQEKRLQRESSKDPEHFDGILNSFDGCQ